MTHNLEQSVRLMVKAAAAGAKVLFLPEASDYIAGTFQESLALARPVGESPYVVGLQSAARKHGIAVNVGIHVPVSLAPSGRAANVVVPTSSHTTSQKGTTTEGPPSVPPLEPGAELPQGQPKLYNRSIWIDADGTILSHATYDKLHLFDFADLRESAHTQAGNAIVPPFDTAVGRVGSLICFDLRFPEPSLRLAHPPPALVARGFRPAQIITYPSAFTVPTGRAHWEVLLRARAIECQSWVVAAAQVGPHNPKRISYGHSMAVDPWGRVVCRLGGVSDDGSVEEDAVEAIGLFDIDLNEWEAVRRKMPLIRRTDVYPEI
ncbi:hypothetical protein VTK73DRAFT_8974 [Phialemonium thermophilum]|uniref:CN hydrolase domain-containing protein n=1 Tax=Phialemonium thermophilum TaxID=223376 RepID=A0ABR3XN28_9PEZI